MYCAVLKLCGAVLLTGKKLESGRSILFCWTKKQQNRSRRCRRPPNRRPGAGRSCAPSGRGSSACRLLRRHRFRRKNAERRMNDLSQKLRASPHGADRQARPCTRLGFAAGICRRPRTGRRVSARQPSGWRPGIAALAHDLAVAGVPRRSPDVAPGPVRPRRSSLSGAAGALLVRAHRMCIGRRKAFGAAAKAQRPLYFTSGIRRNLRLLPRMAMYILPVCALALGGTVFDHMSSTSPTRWRCRSTARPWAMWPTRMSSTLAREDVMERISYAGYGQDGAGPSSRAIPLPSPIICWMRTRWPTPSSRAPGDQIGEGTALYLDGELTAVCNDGDALRAYFTSRAGTLRRSPMTPT